MKSRFTKAELPFSEDGITSKIRASGYFILVKPYVRPRQLDDFELPERTIFEDGHHSLVCEVIDIGPEAYTDEKICGKSAWCQVGEWVVISRATGTRLENKDGVLLRLVNEDQIMAVVKDPEDWQIRIKHTKF